jgi:hypothetical protein
MHSGLEGIMEAWVPLGELVWVQLPGVPHSGVYQSLATSAEGCLVACGDDTLGIVVL